MLPWMEAVGVLLSKGEGVVVQIQILKVVVAVVLMILEMVAGVVVHLLVGHYLWLGEGEACLKIKCQLIRKNIHQQFNYMVSAKLAQNYLKRNLR